MMLTIGEAAALMGCSPRTLRARVARGEIPGHRAGRVWKVDRRSLPLNEEQRQAMQVRAGEVRSAVDAALPSAVARRSGDRTRSLADLDAWRHLRAITVALTGSLAPPVLLQHLDEAADALAEAMFLWEREPKLAALGRTRALLGRTTARLLIAAGEPPAGPLVAEVVRIEQELLPAIGGIARWAAQLGRR